MNIDRFIARHGITFKAHPASRNPNIDDMPAGSRHWICDIDCGGRGMSVHFSQGPAHKDPPTAADVLDCLASDASGYDNAGSFEDWCAEYGFDSDSRRAERTHRNVGRQAEALREILGTPADYETLLYKVERS